MCFWRQRMKFGIENKSIPSFKVLSLALTLLTSWVVLSDRSPSKVKWNNCFSNSKFKCQSVLPGVQVGEATFFFQFKIQMSALIIWWTIPPPLTIATNLINPESRWKVKIFKIWSQKLLLMPVNDPHNDNDDGNQRKSDKRFLQGGEVSLVPVNEPHNNHVCLNHFLTGRVKMI